MNSDWATLSSSYARNGDVSPLMFTTLHSNHFEAIPTPTENQIRDALALISATEPLSFSLFLAEGEDEAALYVYYAAHQTFWCMERKRFARNRYFTLLEGDESTIVQGQDEDGPIEHFCASFISLETAVRVLLTFQRDSAFEWLRESIRGGKMQIMAKLTSAF